MNTYSVKITRNGNVFGAVRVLALDVEEAKRSALAQAYAVEDHKARTVRVSGGPEWAGRQPEPEEFAAVSARVIRKGR